MKKPLAVKLVLACAAVVMALCAGEWLVRTGLGSLPPFSAFRYEPVAFARHALKRESWTVKDGDVSYPINSLGYRGKEFAFHKPPGVVRVIIYGGSTVFDLGARGLNDWPSRVESILHSNGLGHVEVINAGIPGHASGDALGRLYTEGHLLDPDYVMLYTEWNDIKYFREKDPLLRVVRPYREDPRVVDRGPVDRFLCRHSQFYIRLRNQYFDWRYGVGAEGARPGGPGGAGIQDDALKQYRLNVELFVDCARDIGAVPVLVTEARLVAPGNTEEDRRKILYDYVLFDHETLCRAFEDADEILKDVARRKDAPLLDASKALTGHREFFYDHAHTSDRGSQELAQLVAAELEHLIREH